MIEFGTTLRAAREAKGYTVAQVAETTHMAPSTVEDLEKEDFTRIAAPIYGRGFVKLYCEAVGLDPKPMIAEFMDIFNGKREATIKERPIAPHAEPAEPTEPTPAEPQAEQFMPDEAPIQPVEPEKEPDLFSAPQPDPTSLSRYAAPISQTQPAATTSFFSPAVWRISALACAAIVLAWLAFLGIRALYRATSATSDAEGQPAAPTAEEIQQAQTRQPAPEAVKRNLQDIPALYID